MDGVAERLSPRLARNAGVLAAIFAVLYTAGFFIAGSTPGYDEPDQAWVDWFADSGNRTATMIGIGLMVIGLLALIWFASVMSSELRRRASVADAGPTLVVAAGVAAAALSIVGALVATAIAGALSLAPDYDQVPSAETLKAFEQVGIAIWLIGGGWSQALFVATLAHGARRSDLLPKWLTSFGFGAAGVLVLSPFFLPMVFFPLWMLVTAIVLLRTGSDDEHIRVPADLSRTGL